MDAPARHRTPWTDEDFALVASLMQQGRTNREIAKALGRTESTTNVMSYRLGLNRGSAYCLNCAAELEQPAVGRKRRFCDEACRTADERARRQGDREASLDPQRSCPYCGNPIPLDRQRRSSGTVKYCSRTCSQDAWYERKCAAQGRVPVKTGPRRQGTLASSGDSTTTL